jgi:RNA polymerase sigma-70 factor (ECF subfamily)
MASGNQTFCPAPDSKEPRDATVHALETTTDALVTRCVSGDAPAWRELHQRLYPAAASFLRQMGVGAEDLDDLAQDVFLQVFRYLARFEGRADLKTWVYKICSSQVSRLHRKRTIRRTLERLMGSAEPSAAPPADADWGGHEVRREMEGALAQMTERQRLVFVLYELHGLPGSEIAQIVGCPAATVRGRLREARQIFNRVVGDADEGEGS